MEGWNWGIENWMTVLNAVGVVGGLFFTARAFRSEAKTRRIANLLTITSNHRELWKEFFEHPELGGSSNVLQIWSKSRLVPKSKNLLTW